MTDQQQPEKFQCRRCRHLLFTTDNLSADHKIESNCSLWYLNDDDILPWVLTLIDESGWSKGKLYCPQCEARIGAFDFLHIISCECGNEMIPSIYCVKSKVDHMKAINNNNNPPQLGDDGEVDNEAGDRTDEKENAWKNNEQEGDKMQKSSSSKHNDSACQSHRYSTESAIADEDVDVECDLWEQPKEHNFEDVDASFELQAEDHHHHHHPGNEELENLFQIESLDTTIGDCTEHLVPTEIIRSFHPTNSVFENQSFDPDVSDSEDHIVDMKEMCSMQSIQELSQQRGVRNYFNSHRIQPHVLRCSCCRAWYNKVAEDRRRKIETYRCNCNVNRSLQNEFVNISYDASSHTGVVRSRQCTCQNRHGTTGNQRSGDALVEQRLRAAANTNRTGRRPNTPRGIHEDLLEVQQELINLQSIIEYEDTPPDRRARRRRRRRRRNDPDENERSEIEMNIFSLLNNEEPSTATTTTTTTGQQEGIAVEEQLDHQNVVEYELPDQYQCPVCLDILYEPHTTVCSHVFCSPCLRQLNKVSRKKPHCPLCRQRIYTVEPCLEMQDELKRLYPESYRKRSRIENRRPANGFPLPSPTSVRFEQDENEQPGRFVHFLYALRTCLIILFMLITYLLNGEERREHRRYARIFRWFFYTLIGLVLAICGVCVGILFTFYAYDFMKFLIGLSLFYAVITRVLVSFVANN